MKKKALFVTTVSIMTVCVLTSCGSSKQLPPPPPIKRVVEYSVTSGGENLTAQYAYAWFDEGHQENCYFL